jgi:hypothetical protein
MKIPLLTASGTVESFNRALEETKGTDISKTEVPRNIESSGSSLESNETSSVHITLIPDSWPYIMGVYPSRVYIGYVFTTWRRDGESRLQIIVSEEL